VHSRLVGLKPAHVWDISQTDGDPIPQTPHPTLLEAQSPEGLWDGLADQITAHGFEHRLVSNAAAIGGANGFTDYMTREVSVRMDIDDAAQVKTLAHELGHVMLHGPDNADAAMHRGIAEVEAESVALLVGAAHGTRRHHGQMIYHISVTETATETAPKMILKPRDRPQTLSGRSLLAEDRVSDSTT